MPRLTISYANSVIYKIVCRDLNITDCYVGHTTSFKDRKREHKSRCNCKVEFKIYSIINANGGWDNWEMIEIEKYPCETSNEAKARERFWYEELNAKLNARIPIILDQKEHTHIRNTSEGRREYMREYMKMRREDKEYPY